MEIQRIAAFSYHNQGGNPAGVVIGSEMPTEDEMLNTAKIVGYSETAFLHPFKDGWRIRYFAPEMEVPFCGHATIATGAALGERFGAGTYKLFLNKGDISVSVSKSETAIFTATLQSPATWSKTAPQAYVKKILTEFNYSFDDLNADYPIRFASAGAKHLILVLKNRKNLADMSYQFDRMKRLMQEEGLVTINLLWIESYQLIHSRNPFAAGGVYEDPATGAAAAAFAGYLRDIKWQGGNQFDISQGEDMGHLSRLSIEYTPLIGDGIKVTGETRHISESSD